MWEWSEIRSEFRLPGKRVYNTCITVFKADQNYSQENNRFEFKRRASSISNGCPKIEEYNLFTMPKLLIKRAKELRS